MPSSSINSRQIQRSFPGAVSSDRAFSRRFTQPSAISLTRASSNRAGEYFPMPTVTGRAMQVSAAGGAFELVQKQFPEPGPGTGSHPRPGLRSVSQRFPDQRGHLARNSISTRTGPRGGRRSRCGCAQTCRSLKWASEWAWAGTAATATTAPPAVAATSSSAKTSSSAASASTAATPTT